MTHTINTIRVHYQRDYHRPQIAWSCGSRQVLMDQVCYNINKGVCPSASYRTCLYSEGLQQPYGNVHGEKNSWSMVFNLYDAVPPALYVLGQHDTLYHIVLHRQCIAVQHCKKNNNKANAALQAICATCCKRYALHVGGHLGPRAKRLFNPLHAALLLSTTRFRQP